MAAPHTDTGPAHRLILQLKRGHSRAKSLNKHRLVSMFSEHGLLWNKLRNTLCHVVKESIYKHFYLINDFLCKVICFHNISDFRCIHSFHLLEPLLFVIKLYLCPWKVYCLPTWMIDSRIDRGGWHFPLQNLFIELTLSTSVILNRN